MTNGQAAGVMVLGLMACSSISAREPDRPGDPGTSRDRAATWSLLPGTLIVATVEHTNPWRRDATGGTLTAMVSADVYNARRSVVIPAGAPVGLRVAHWQPAVSANPADATVTLEVRSLTVRGRQFAVHETAVVTAPTVFPLNSGIVRVAVGTRIFFVLSEGFTAVHD